MQDIKMECACINSVKYNKLVTAGNDPSISKKMKYASYIRTHGATQSHNVGKKTFTNIGIIPPLTQKQIEIEHAVEEKPYTAPVLVLGNRTINIG